jgi:thymidylate synthase (FAD)
MKVELLSHFGGDLMIANVARVSYGKESDKLSEKDARLLKFLAEHKHTSPFRHAQLQFRIECPIFVERQLFTHQIGWARNSISGRYVDFSDSYWLPERLRFQSKDSKQGSAGELPEEKNKYFLSKIEEIIKQSSDLYAEMSEFGVAKELCRIHLPLCLETKFIWTGSFHAFSHLCSLRLKADTQAETREVVQKMVDAVKNIENNPFKYSLEAWGL